MGKPGWLGVRVRGVLGARSSAQHRILVLVLATLGLTVAFGATGLCNWVAEWVDAADDGGDVVAIGDLEPSVFYCDVTNGVNQGLWHARLHTDTWQYEQLDVEKVNGVSAAGTPAGHFWVIYYAPDSQELRCAHYDGTAWSVEIVATGLIGLRTGGAVRVDNLGRPHLSYFLATGQLYGEIRYAWRDSAGWHDSVVVFGYVGGQSLALSTSGAPSICYISSASMYGYYYLKYAWHDGSYWQSATVDSSVRANQPSLSVDSAGWAHVAYWDSTNRRLRYARGSGTAWDVQIVDPESSAGFHHSLALDSGGRPHICYEDSTSSGLKYAHNDGGGVASRGC